MSTLQGKTAIITGGSTGIGLAIAKRFVAEGAYVFITGRTQRTLDEARALVGRNVTAIRSDTSEPGDLDRAFAAIRAERGTLDIVVANAGRNEQAALADATPEHFDKLFGVNVRGVYFTVQKALPLLVDGASIVLIASAVHARGLAGLSVYSASKAAVRSNAAAAHGGRATPSGQLRISVPPGLSAALAPLLTGFCAAYPLVTIVVQLSSRFVDLEAEHFDVALRATAKLADSSLVAIRVGDPQPEGILVGAPTYLDANPPVRRAADLAAHRFLALGDTGAAYALPLARRGTTETTVLRLPVAVAGSDLGFLKEMTLHGAGITVLPRLHVQRELDDGRLVHILPSHVWPSAGLFMLHRGGPFVAPKVRAFLDYMRAALRPGAASDHRRTRR